MSTVDPMVDGAHLDDAKPVTRESHVKALADLYRDHHRDLLRVLTPRTGSRDAAKEILQEAYAKMLELDRPETAGFLRFYLWRTAQNLATNRRKWEATRARPDLKAKAKARLLSDEYAPSPEELLFEQQSLELLEQAIDKLPPDQFQAFVLRVQHELTFKQIAERMNIGERMAQLHVARALEFCHGYLQRGGATGSKQHGR